MKGPPRQLQYAWAAGLGILLVPVVIVLLSVTASPESNTIARLTLTAFCIFAAAKPDAALLVTIAFLGFGATLAHMAGVPSLRTTEVLVVASLGGYAIRSLADRSHYQCALSRSIATPVVLFAITAVASAAVWMRVSQAHTSYASTFVQELLHALSRKYFIAVGEFWELVPTAVLIEGLALFLVMAAVSRADALFFRRAVRMLVAGGVGVASLSAVRLAEVSLRNPGAIDALRDTSAGLRISPQIADYIAAGSYFGLCWFALLGVAIASTRRKAVWLLALSIPLLAALYLTGSRSVIAATAVGLAVLLAVVFRQSGPPAKRTLAFAGLAVLVMIVSYPWMTGRDLIGTLAGQSLTVRTELVRTSIRVIASRPVFGVGLDRYHLAAASRSSPELDALWHGRKNPHNDFLRVGAELGLIGLGAFLWILAAVARRIWGALKRSDDARLAGLTAGLAAFLVTSFVSDPLMVREVSYAFWIVLGLAAGRAAAPVLRRDVRQPNAPSPCDRPRRVARVRWPMTIGFAGLLLASVPFRAARELTSGSLAGVSYGLYEWEADEEGRAFRWSGPRFTLFVDGRARSVEVQVSGALPEGTPQELELRLDGRLANRFVVGRNWVRIRAALPPSRSVGVRRLEFRVDPSWVRAEHIPDNQDRRVLGIRVAEVKAVVPRDGTAH